MTVRLQELHPALVHLPIALLPVAIGADLVGRMSGNQSLMETGRRAMTLAAAGAIVSVTTGMIAQEEVNAKGDAHDLLITHRNLNIAATVVATLMAHWRSAHARPSVAYLALGAASVAVVAYTANLGGQLVYHQGVGVEPAHGQYRADAPELRPGELRRFVTDAVTDLVHGVEHLTQETAQGKLVPSLNRQARA
jgi:uncharacterized membrane protein